MKKRIAKFPKRDANRIKFFAQTNNLAQNNKNMVRLRIEELFVRAIQQESGAKK